MEKLFIYGICFMAMITTLKIFVVWSLTKLNKVLNTAPKSKLTAEDIIASGKGIQVKSRSKDIEDEYETLKSYFKSLLQNKKLSRADILAIRDYLYKNVKQYDKKKFKNDAHAIYTMLKATDLTKQHIYTIANHLESLDCMNTVQSK